MRVCLVVPSRGGVEPLKETLPITLKNSTMSNTKIVVGFDRDEFRESWLTEIQTSDKVLACVEKREDSLGAKYNRCASAHDADLYLIGKDHIALSTYGWDELCNEYAALFTDGIGFLSVGKEPHGEPYPSILGVTRKTLEVAGIGLMVTHYPYWWGNTTWCEIGWMLERFLTPPVETSYPAGFPGRYRRDVKFWADFFYETRPGRCGLADKLLKQMNEPPHRRRHLALARAGWIASFEQSHDVLRDPEKAARIEQQMSLSEPLDDRHRRLRDQAERILERIKSAGVKNAGDNQPSPQ